MCSDSLKECLKVELKRSDETFVNELLMACRDPPPWRRGEVLGGGSEIRGNWHLCQPERTSGGESIIESGQSCLRGGGRVARRHPGGNNWSFQKIGCLWGWFRRGRGDETITYFQRGLDGRSGIREWNRRERLNLLAARKRKIDLI
jgi:hypothetical protein